MLIQSPSTFNFGVTTLTGINGPYPEALMDFQVLRQKTGDVYLNSDNLERACTLVYGTIKLEWLDQQHVISRSNCFDENPWVLHLPAGVPVSITGVSEDSEVSIIGVENSQSFESKLYAQTELHSEDRGAGTMKETSTRIVRTVLDLKSAPWSKLVLGEVIDFPGKWSSYPPHHHTQPEIYYYKFNPENGYGHSEVGEDVYKVRQNDAVVITENLDHPQVAAPGYAMWYLWVIRHLDNDLHTGPTFTPEHLWVSQPDAVIWPDHKQY